MYILDSYGRKRDRVLSAKRIEHRWLRWYNAEGWVLTSLERERQHAERLIAQLRALGIEPDGENG